MIVIDQNHGLHQGKPERTMVHYRWSSSMIARICGLPTDICGYNI